MNDDCSNKVENIKLDRPPEPGVGSKGQNSTFQNMVMLHIKLNGFTNAAKW